MNSHRRPFTPLPSLQRKEGVDNSQLSGMVITGVGEGLGGEGEVGDGGDGEGGDGEDGDGVEGVGSEPSDPGKGRTGGISCTFQVRGFAPSMLRNCVTGDGNHVLAQNIYKESG